METINIDPKWDHNGECECWCCVRAREQHAVCDSALERFCAWRAEVGLDEKEHQLVGLKWALYHELCESAHQSVRGGVIADEMGLGKTILMLGCIRVNFLARTLIVVPPALLSQWRSVILRFFGHDVFVFHGKRAKRVSISELVEKPIVLTTYGMISKRSEPGKLHQLRWSRLILDEAHHARNMKTAVHKGAAELEADIRWLVTGTPINNRVTDFYALCAILRLDKSFTTDVDKLKDIIGIHLLRRTKAGVGIKLPPIRTHEEVVEWDSQDEFELARDIHAVSNFTKVHYGNVNALIAFLSRHPLPAMTRMRQICVYPQLLHEAVAKMKRRGIIDENMNLKSVASASKIAAVVRQLVKNSANGRRKLVFCHYRGEMDIIARALRVHNISYGLIDGRTKIRERRCSVMSVLSQGDFRLVCKSWNDADNQGAYNLISRYLAPEVMVVQIQTACEGLNMQHFQEIYFVSPHWNPAVEDQAIARSHRIGQDQPVDVYRFMMAGFGHNGMSLDQYCKEIQDTKREATRIFGQ